MATISVIVPVFKVEPYLRKCVDSILAQTYHDIELILVDDGSPDDCPHICDEYAQKDSRIKVIHKDNEGLSSARNAGLNIAKGDYISFIDSDDYVEKSFLEELYNSMVINNVDISVCCFSYVCNGIITPTLIYDSCKNSMNENDYMLFALNNVNGIVAWNKLYKASLFSELRYPKGRLHEDEYLIHRIIHEARKIVVIDRCLYNYVIRNDSIINQQNDKKILDAIDALIDRTQFYFSKRNKLLLSKSYLSLIIMFLNYHRNVVSKNECTETLMCEIKKLVKKVPLKLIGVKKWLIGRLFIINYKLVLLFF